MSSTPKIVLHLSSVDYGGAGLFAVDFHRFFRREGHDSYLVVKDKRSEGADVIRYPDDSQHRLLAKLRRRVAKAGLASVRFDADYYFQNRYETMTIASARRILGLLPRPPEVIFIHWVTAFINAEIIGDLHRLTGARIYWLMIDNAPITGGCHYPWACVGYQRDCGNCPAILTPSAKVLAKQNLSFKLKHLPESLALLAFSQPDYARAKKSALFGDKEVTTLLGFVEETKFKPGDKADAKAFFGIPPAEKVLFFGASSLKERRKGMSLLLQAVEQIRDEDFFLLVAGEMPISTLPQRNVKMVGKLSEKDLIKAYQAAHMFVCPSLEDSGPMMINQSIMCGTPVVSFNTGVAQNLVHSGETGYRATTGDPLDMAKGIKYLLGLSTGEYQAMGTHCRQFAVKHYGVKASAQKIKALLSSQVPEKSNSNQ